MNETYPYARRGTEQAHAGGVIVAAISVLAAVLVAAGLWYAAGTGERHKVALAAAGCEPNLSPSGLPCTTVQMLTSQYTKMTTPAVQQLNADVAAYTASEGSSLAAAKAALMAEVTSATALARSLTRFPFPPAVVPEAKALIQAIDGRVKLIAEQAQSSSLGQLQSFNNQIDIASAAIQTDMTLVGKALDKPPTVAQEP